MPYLNQTPPENIPVRRDWRGLLLFAMALLIYWIGPGNLIRDRNVKLGEEVGLEEMLARTGAVSDCGIEPRRAIFEMQPIDLNRADAEVLASLKGIGPALADRIVAYRDRQGGFKRVSEIMEITGIGQGKMAAIINEVTVGYCE
ncbi:MAG: helix-hairpin-helix domain-containing protein [Desulfurivibrionaceae bacterium]|nr:helix-hairpin-helix domain-containing protein [Desulfobulbales bacterium]MDT8335325.1 helix-hairpin-helix domain-containing protein [Desulfurivibrionaceae bacterium]